MNTTHHHRQVFEERRPAARLRRLRIAWRRLGLLLAAPVFLACTNSTPTAVEIPEEAVAHSSMTNGFSSQEELIGAALEAHTRRQP